MFRELHSALPWSLILGSCQPQHFQLSNAHDANRTIVRIDVHESLGKREAIDLATAIKKVAKHYRAVAQPLLTFDTSGELARPSEFAVSVTQL